MHTWETHLCSNRLLIKHRTSATHSLDAVIILQHTFLICTLRLYVNCITAYDAHSVYRMKCRSIISSTWISPTIRASRWRLVYSTYTFSRYIYDHLSTPFLSSSFLYDIIIPILFLSDSILDQYPYFKCTTSRLLSWTCKWVFASLLIEWHILSVERWYDVHMNKDIESWPSPKVGEGLM